MITIKKYATILGQQVVKPALKNMQVDRVSIQVLFLQIKKR